MRSKKVKTSKWAFLVENIYQEKTTSISVLKNSNKNSAKDEVFYRSAWKELPHQCINCHLPLRGYSRSYISHLISKGSNTALRHDIRNVVPMCYDCHQTFEFGKRSEMKIWPELQERIRLLLLEHYGDKEKK